MISSSIALVMSTVKLLVDHILFCRVTLAAYVVVAAAVILAAQTMPVTVVEFFSATYN